MKNKKFSTIAIKTEKSPSPSSENSTPIFLNSGFRFNDLDHAAAIFKEEVSGYAYSRYDNPSVDEFISKVCALENKERGFATASGMAAVFLCLAGLLKAGDHLIASKTLFGSTYQIITKILPRWNIDYTFVDIKDTSSWEKAVQKNTKLFFVETPTNPTVELLDLQKAGELCRNHNFIFAVDNCFATPYLQQPTKFGAQVIVHSATKFIDGQGRVLGGILVCDEELYPDLRLFSRQTGPSMSAFNAWILSKSLETLSVRMDRHCQNAKELATRLNMHRAIKKVNYPFLSSYPQHQLALKQMSQGGGLVSFEIQGDIARCKNFVDSLQDIKISANLGDSRTLVTHPSLTTHSSLTPDQREAMGISDNLVRLSVGLEDIEDIWQDIEQALDICLQV